jgi:hypothetical protein
LPLLECVHVLIKFAQNTDVFVCELMDNVNLAQQELLRLNNKPFTKYEDSTFDNFNYPLVLSNDTFPMN